MGAHWYRLSAGNVVSRATVQAQTYTADPAGPSIARLRLPLLVFYGDRDVGGEVELATIRAAARAARVTTHLITGADHVYTDREEEAAALIAGWAESPSRHREPCRNAATGAPGGRTRVCSSSRTKPSGDRQR